MIAKNLGRVQRVFHVERARRVFEAGAVGPRHDLCPPRTVLLSPGATLSF
jgi:hypothetical protein